MLAEQLKGPGKIVKKLSETNYVVKSDEINEKNLVYHSNVLNPYYKRKKLIKILHSLVNNEPAEIVN